MPEPKSQLEPQRQTEESEVSDTQTTAIILPFQKPYWNWNKKLQQGTYAKRKKKKIQPYPNPTCVWTPHLQPLSNFLSDCVYVYVWGRNDHHSHTVRIPSARILFHQIHFGVASWRGKKKKKKIAGLWHFLLHGDAALLFVTPRRTSQKPIKIPDVGGKRNANWKSALQAHF